jgi:hypothetical protein
MPKPSKDTTIDLPTLPMYRHGCQIKVRRFNIHASNLIAVVDFVDTWGGISGKD